MVLVFDVDTLQNSDNELIDYFVNSKHAVRELKVRPNYVTFRDRFRNNNYATFLLNPNTGKITVKSGHLSFNEENENANNEVWKSPDDWIDTDDIAKILKKYIVRKNTTSKRSKSIRKGRKARNVTRKN
jgi:hypothetical protein